MQRRGFLTLTAAAAAQAMLPGRAGASVTVPKPYDWAVAPPTESAPGFIRWMQENRGENPQYLRARFERFRNMVAHVDLWEDRNKRAFLLTPREEFCLPATGPSSTAGGQIAVRRSDIYGDRPVPFVAFTKLQGDAIKGTHNQR